MGRLLNIFKLKDDDQNYDMNVRFDSADEEDGIVEVVVEYK